MAPWRLMMSWVGSPKTPYVFMVAAYASRPMRYRGRQSGRSVARCRRPPDLAAVEIGQPNVQIAVLADEVRCPLAELEALALGRDPVEAGLRLDGRCDIAAERTRCGEEHQRGPAMALTNPIRRVVNGPLR